MVVYDQGRACRCAGIGGEQGIVELMADGAKLLPELDGIRPSFACKTGQRIVAMPLLEVEICDDVEPAYGHQEF